MSMNAPDVTRDRLMAMALAVASGRFAATHTNTDHVEQLSAVLDGAAREHVRALDNVA